MPWGVSATRNLFRLIRELLENGEAVTLVTVAASSGSTPRGAGARMLVTAKGRCFGTIGGGAVEHSAIQTAQELIALERSDTRNYRLHKNDIQDLGMVCGGNVDVCFRYIPARDAAMLALAAKAEEMFARREPCWLISETAARGAMGIFSEGGGLFGEGIPEDIPERLGDKPVQLEHDGRCFYCERLMRAGVVYIFGGGHVAQALTPALAAVDFCCVVIEDRPEFCKRELFPGAEEARLMASDNVSGVGIGKADYVVIVTRGHKDDELILTQVLRTSARYIGVIGSRRKMEGVFANLREKGFTEDELKRVVTPIGLDIGAQTPAEIAVSIAAQLIMTRAGRSR